ncbi:MAG TPA: alpha/beta hydrolase, partial [Candidatus Angelobacter sp.]|nr:alpha/beta hydrolase [Candidatus Angelobacter sp.]
QLGKSVRLGPEFGNMSLNLNCYGEGSPTVVLDAGLGVPAHGRKPVQPAVAKFARVCSYDRVGYGWSDAGPMPRTSSEIAKELHALLAAAGENRLIPLLATLLAASTFGYSTALIPMTWREWCWWTPHTKTRKASFRKSYWKT